MTMVTVCSAMLHMLLPKANLITVSHKRVDIQHTQFLTSYKCNVPGKLQCVTVNISV